jgi:hypothetical protein
MRATSIDDDDVEEVREVLSPEEFELWTKMGIPDRCHSIEVYKRFLVLCPGASVDEERAALLHDIGKIDSGLGTWMRVVATVVGPRTQRFRQYHDHESIGVGKLSGISSPRTIEVMTSVDDDVAQALRQADNV